MGEQFDLYKDAILLMACLGAALYCMKLQVAIRRLHRADRGVGKAVQALTEATRASHSAAAEIREQVREAIAELDEKVGTLKGQRAQIDDLLDVIDGQMAHQIDRCDEARKLTEEALTPLVHRAELEIQALTKAIEISARLTRMQANEVNVSNIRSETGRSERGESNPFLKAVGT